MLSTETDKPSEHVDYRYDTHGSMLNLNRTPDEFDLAWDYRDMIQTVNLGGGGRAWYSYDAGKQRTRKRVERIGGAVEERLYLGGMELYRRTKGGTVEEEIETHHLFVGDQRALSVDDVLTTNNTDLGTGTLYRYQHGNHLGSAALELDASAAFISYEEYHPYGTTAYHARGRGVRATAKRYRYTGMERDEETGLSYHTARYYLPWLGRWNNIDPAGLIDGTNLYLYARNSPMLWSDSTGLDVRIVGTRISDPQRARQQPIQVTSETARVIGERDLFMGMTEEEARLFTVRGDGFVVLRDPAMMTDLQLRQLSQQAQVLVNLTRDNNQHYVIHPLPVQDSGTPAWVQNSVLSGGGLFSLRVSSDESGGEEYDIDIRIGLVANVARRSAAGLTMVSPARDTRSRQACAQTTSCNTGRASGSSTRNSGSIPSTTPVSITSRVDGETQIYYSTGRYADRLSTQIRRREVIVPTIQSIQESRSGVLWHELGHADLSRRGLPHFHGDTPFHETIVEPFIEELHQAGRGNARRRAPRVPEPQRPRR
jgi:RHS repeat-associated protein